MDKPCSKKSDIWALGVVLYELCAKRYPYEATEMEELEQKVLKEKYGTIPNTVSKDFKLVIEKCLKRKPEMRPSIDDIIFNDMFQQKCKLNRITLPLELNKSKLLQKIQTNKHVPATANKTIADSKELFDNLKEVGGNTSNNKKDGSVPTEKSNNTSYHSRPGSAHSQSSPFKGLNQGGLSNDKTTPT